MSGDTITQTPRLTCTLSRAARELGLKRREFDLAVHLGRIRTVFDEGGGGRRVEHAEIDRLRAEEGEGGPCQALKESVRAVGATEGAKLMGVPVGRFTRLARLGLVTPVTFYLNRYRAVVWLYLAEELRQFSSDEKNSRLLTGRTPETLRDQLRTGLDLRARNWRGRRLGFLLRQATDPWERAGAVAAFLDPVHVADVVKDPYERAHLNRFRPGPPSHGAPGSPSVLLAERIMRADDADEIEWLRHDLALALDEARGDRSAPRPTPRQVPDALVPQPPEPVRDVTVVPCDTTATRHRASTPGKPGRPPHRLRGWLRRRSPRPVAR
ncbi:DUF6397 family protein [Streptomyces sp. V3I7]|uniref:DUF6397 family protein n=1 Tax=Streptomyces sp. V3I7 TaxID=3042278 RepID=UPI002786E13C|nr:DUF6397 family protein [Streptomyces sp. V3I7]MDQ0989368.1 hypothetical protein [Streptomyces sp. V3I7]